MEFHDILHGLISIDEPGLQSLLEDLLNTPEVHRLRNMRQMNFDVPLIQELGRSRRLPHSIGVVAIALQLARKSGLSHEETCTLATASLLHDAAIPPFGHLVESEFKKIDPEFNHESILKQLIYGLEYEELIPGDYPSLSGVKPTLERHHVSVDQVLDLAYPKHSHGSPISAAIDIDNMDNIHRMAAMLGWPGAKENLAELLEKTRLNGISRLEFDESAESNINVWLDYRQRIYTMIIAHKQCIPYNALQADISRIAVSAGIITPKQWWVTEPVFEEMLRKDGQPTKELALQLIGGCSYKLLDYIWLKDLDHKKKLTNADINDFMLPYAKQLKDDLSLFVWYENGLISREVEWHSWQGKKIRTGSPSSSCMIALIDPKGRRGNLIPKKSLNNWKQITAERFQLHTGLTARRIASPEDYTGDYFRDREDGFGF